MLGIKLAPRLIALSSRLSYKRKSLNSPEASVFSKHHVFLECDTVSTITDVIFKELRTFPDSRGFFREVVRDTDEFFSAGFAQWSHSKMCFNTVKAWHFHHKQTDWWYCPLGVIEVVLYDLREESPTFEQKLVFKLGDKDDDPEAQTTIVSIPPGVFHACKVLTEFAHLFYITSEIYNPDDEGRYPYNSDKIPHSWNIDESEIIVSERDTKLFIPPHPRTQMAGA